MKKILLGLVAAAALTAFVTPARAEGEAADAGKTDAAAKKGKKGKKGKKAEGEAGGEAAPAGDAAKK